VSEDCSITASVTGTLNNVYRASFFQTLTFPKILLFPQPADNKTRKHNRDSAFESGSDNVSSDVQSDPFEMSHIIRSTVLSVAV
jgi:hypothetical protein